MANRGGSRPGAGRKSSGPETVPVNWRVSSSAKSWMKNKAFEERVSIGAILDRLVEHYDAVGLDKCVDIVAQQIQDRITAEVLKPTKLISDCMDDYWTERAKLKKCCDFGLPAKINGKVVRVLKFGEWYDPYSRNSMQVSYDAVPMEEVYDEKDVIEINLSKFEAEQGYFCGVEIDKNKGMSVI